MTPFIGRDFLVAEVLIRSNAECFLESSSPPTLEQHWMPDPSSQSASGLVKPACSCFTSSSQIGYFSSGIHLLSQPAGVVTFPASADQVAVFIHGKLAFILS
jgi:hypothetical protein